MITANEELQMLFSRIKLKDKKAFERLYNRTNRRLYGLLIKIVADRDIAAELLQEGYLKIWFTADHSPVSYPWAWMCQLMRNLAIDHIRQHGRLHPIFEENDILPEAKGNNETDAADDLSILNRCLYSLAQEKRQAIKLAYIHGYSHEEIVERLAHPLGTIKSWIRRGLKELKQCIDA
ncbi:RNA polymerase sigma factor [Serratia aquatilis]|uniref:RNA polymerase sigma factor n=1 Tax=Serratia aquatilis TaxID=1737515 RepID=A0ABV6EJR0_9GAMM